MLNYNILKLKRIYLTSSNLVFFLKKNSFKLLENLETYKKIQDIMGEKNSCSGDLED